MFDSGLNTEYGALSQEQLSKLYSDLKLCTASDTFRILAYSELCLFRYMQANSNMSSIIKTYSCIVTHYLGIFRFIQAYSEPTGSIFKALGNL